jgi:hypothetical protein
MTKRDRLRPVCLRGLEQRLKVQNVSLRRCGRREAPAYPGLGAADGKFTVDPRLWIDRNGFEAAVEILGGLGAEDA